MITSRRYMDGDMESIVAREQTVLFAPSDWTWTILKDGAPVAVFCVLRFWSGVGHIAGVVDDRVKNDGLAFTKESRKLLSAAIESLTQYQRFQAYTIGTANARWAAIMGLKYECTMHRASEHGEDIHIYYHLR